MDNISTIGSILGIAVVLGGIIGAAGASRSSAIKKGLTQLLSVRDLQIADNTKSLADKDKQIAALTAERDSLTQQVQTLSSFAQSTTKLQEILDYIRKKDA